MLDIQDLRIHFRNAPPGKDAVKGICLHMDRGEILGLVGESGSGKTVTAMALAGLLSNAKTQLTGQIFFEGLDLLQASRETVRALRGKDIAVVFQEPMTSMDPVMRVGPQVEEALLVHTDLSPQERRQRALAAMADAELPDPETVYRKYPHELSGGMLQRAMVAAAIISEPKLLICDEPTTALDVTIQEGILNLLKKINREKGTGILFISHNLHVVRKLCTRVAVMCKGELLEEGPVDEIFFRPQAEYTKGLIAAIPTRRKRG
ncbi:MAG: ABC transporter ATP-binding protein [Clostridiales bacterium]|nr:ABC transporter ATP-binding protein [Clostridiales bacterium]